MDVAKQILLNHSKKPLGKYWNVKYKLVFPV